MFTTGEGGVSTGSMVPVYDVREAARGAQVVALLEAHAIPAILDSELVGVPGLPRHELPRVLVPSSMLRAARAVLLEHSSGVGQPDPRQLSALLTWVPAKVEDPPPLQPRLTPPEDDVVYEEEPDEITQPIERLLPSSGPVFPRLSLALAAVLFGLVLQFGLEAVLGHSQTIQALGATTAHLAQLPLRLVSAGFIHGGPAHMLSNAAFGVVLGVVLFGTHRVGATAFVWLLSSMVGIGLEAALSPGTLVIGASAGNYGLVGLWACGQLQRAQRSALPRRERLRTIGLLLLLIPGALTPFSATGTRVAVVAHAVGFMVGFLLGFPYARRLDASQLGRIDDRARWAGVAAMVLTALLLSGAVATALIPTST